MALVWVEGFENYTQSSDFTARGYTINGTNFQFGQTGRLGTGTSCYFADDRILTTPDNILASPTVITGFAYKIDDQNTQNVGSGFLLYFYNATTLQLTISLTQSGHFFASRAGGTLLGSIGTIGVPNNGTWFWVEAKVVINSSTGSVLVKVNGQTVLNLTNVNTQQAASANVTKVALAADNFPGWFDDWYIADNTGSFNNDFLGSIKVLTSNPIGNGSTNQWTPVGAASNYQCVDETAVANGNTDYVEDSTAGHVDLYDVTNVPTGLSGKAVWVECSAEKTIAGTRQIRLQAHSSASDATSGVLSPTQSVYGYFGYAFDKDPNGNIDWTGTNINAAEFGVKLEA
jgi:hypothetical protein